MSAEPSPIPDLASLDLAQSFLPSWAKGAATSERVSRLVEKHGNEPVRDRRDDRRDGLQGGRRPQRREGGGPGGRRDDKRDRGPRRDERRPERESRPEPAVLGWDIQFLPDRPGVEGMVKQIKTSAKSYPLFDLARLVLEKSERYHVEFKRASEDATPLFQLKANGSLWLSESEAVAHALASQLEKYYRRERVSVDPPKGNYAFVAVCGLSGTLLGPPNYHDYQAKLIRLHAARFANMPFEAFKSRIRMEKDEALIEQWRTEQGSKEVFFPRDPFEEAARAAEPAPAVEAQETPVATEEPTAEVTEQEPDAPVDAEAPVSEAEPVTEIVAESGPETVEEQPAADAIEAEATPEAKPAEQLSSLAEVERHFRENHLAKAIVRIRERVVSPGPAALNDSAPSVLRLTRAAWEQLDKFPLPLAHRLAQHLSSRGLQIFKTHEHITYAGVARPHYLDLAVTPVSETLRDMVRYIEEHPAVPRAAQWKALVALRPQPAEGAEGEIETAVAADLFWLLHEGHVIDYARRGLEATRKPKSPTPKAAPKKASVAAPVVVAQEPAPEPSASMPEQPPTEVASDNIVEAPAGETGNAPEEEV
jgi:hypothetical protein